VIFGRLTRGDYCSGDSRRWIGLAMLAQQSQAIQTCPSSPPPSNFATAAVLLKEGVERGQAPEHKAGYYHG